MAEVTSREPDPGARSARSGGLSPEARLAMFLFLAALGMLFAASMMGYVVIRSRAAAWPPEGSPRLPGGLWISTIILLASSVSMQWALRAARAGRTAALRHGLHLTLLLGLAFLFNQEQNWRHFLLAHHLAPRMNLYAFTFYLLTGLHAAHVIGGLAGLGITVGHAAQGRYVRENHAGVERMAMYWHFLDVVWLVIFLSLLVV